MANKVKFLPDDIEAEPASNENLFQLSKRVGVKVPTACNGSGTCGLCRIKIIDGEEFLNKQTKAEVAHLGNVYFINKTRLSCQTKCVKDGIIIVKAQ